MNPTDRPPVQGSIKFLSGPLAGNMFSINKLVTTIGQDSGNDIVIKNDPNISPHHARLLWQEGNWSIEKHPQASSLTINQQDIEKAIIHDNTIISLGPDTTICFFTYTEVQDVPESKTEPLIAQKASPAPPSATALISDPSITLLPLASVTPIPSAPAHGSTKVISGPEVTAIAPLSTLGIPSLEISNNTTGERKNHPLDKQIISIGRNAINDIVINDRIVSGLHLQIVRQGNQLILIHPHAERQETLNGLLYQGRKIRGDESFRKVLARGDIFRIGNEKGSFVTLTFNDGSGMQQEALPPVQPIKLGTAEITIGRSPDNTVVLAHPQVSAHHARLVREAGAYRIFDLNSTNHVYVNSELITHQLLKMGDEIRIGPYRLMYESTQLTEYDESNYIRIDALNLKKSGNNHAILLNNISLSIPPRKFVAVVGGSGAGKSTLMDALSGLRPAHEGKVLYNGQDYYRNLVAFNTQLGYVPQEDIVHRDLTVERALYYAAKLRLPRDFTHEQIMQRIQEVLEDVEMTERRGLLIRKLSGGQRKRVSIALELLANPSLFFLDEPTSGLDPGLDRKMMFLLRKLADKGHTIILVTHATNNITTCDYVCFLAQGGRLAYFGPPDKAKAFFSQSDFAEIYTTLEPSEENPNAPEEAEAKFKLSGDYQEYVVKLRKEKLDGVNGHQKSKVIKRPRRGNPWNQFTLLTMRHTELLKNDVSNLFILILQAPLIALMLMLLVRYEIGSGIFDTNNLVQCRTQILTASGPLAVPTFANSADLVDCSHVVDFLKTDPNGIAYAQSRGGVNQALQDFITPAGSGDAQRVIFLVAFFAVLFGCINGSREIVKEAAIYQRERTVNLGIVPYMGSKIVVLGIIALLQSVSILFITEAFEPFQQHVFLPALLEIYITLALVAIAGVMMGLTISAFAPNDDSANSLLPIIIIPQVIFAGSIIPLKDWLTWIVSAIFPTRWAMAALGSTIGLHSDKIDGGKLFGNDYVYHSTLFSIYSQADATQRILLAWGALWAIIVVLTCLVGFFLKRKDVRGR
jgi:ABC-type multidrug transport system ATPase subunit/pSer/pThr/pTyr-binding forkhead associated (FHA) protein/ABC-type multidrug transport system permease subunit